MKQTAMGLDLNKLCINCMREKGSGPICPHCGFNESEYTAQVVFLRPRSTLNQGRFVVGRSLGKGGFGITYIGLDLTLQEIVAIKEFYPAHLVGREPNASTVVPTSRPEAELLETGLKRFIGEARKLVPLRSHQNVVNVFNFFEENGTAYIIMEYVPGKDLGQYLREKGGRLSAAEAMEIMTPVMDALETAHAQGILHLDVSAQNIRLTDRMKPVLIDFGAAKLEFGEMSRSLEVVINPGYSPMEQYASQGRLGPWSDVYAVGALLTLLLSGELPPDATSRLYKDNTVPLHMIPGVDATEALSEVILRSIAIGHEERYQSIGELRSALEAARWQITASPPETLPETQVEQPVQPAPPPPRPQPPQPPPETSPRPEPPPVRSGPGASLILAIIAGILFAVVVVGGGLAWHFGMIDFGGSGGPTTTEAERDPQTPEERNREMAAELAAEAENALDAGDEGLAREKLDQASEISPGHPDVKRVSDRLADLGRQNENTEEARELAREAESAIDAGNLDRAEEKLDRARELASDDPDVRRAAQRLTAARNKAADRDEAWRLATEADQAMDAGDLDRAERNLSRARKLDPDDAYVQRVSARLAALRKVGANNAEARRLAALGRQALDRGDVASAEAYLNQAQSLDPAEPAVTDLSAALAEKKQTLAPGNPETVIRAFYDAANKKEVTRALNMWTPSQRTSSRRQMIQNIVWFNVQRLNTTYNDGNRAVVAMVARGQSVGEPAYTWSLNVIMQKYGGEWKIYTWKNMHRGN